MHGRQRTEYKALQRDTKVAAKLGAKAVAWHELQAALLQRRVQFHETYTGAVENSESHGNTLQLIEKAVTVNPDPIWLWNFRRELIECEMTIAATDEESFAERIWAREQTLTQTALMGNPKAYGAWHHRKCCLQQYLTSTILAGPIHSANNSARAVERAQEILKFELGLTATFFRRDERNFHCWSYRRFVVSCSLWVVDPTGSYPNGEWSSVCMDSDSPLPAKSLQPADSSMLWMGAQIAKEPTSEDDSRRRYNKESVNGAMWKIILDEWDFAGLKIRDNFSNFSAFHYRSKLLPLMIAPPSSSMTSSGDDAIDRVQSVLAVELELIANAIFTEPDDQTTWWYQHFLLNFVLSLNATLSNGQHLRPNIQNWFQTSLLQPHIEQLRELQAEMDNQSKWVWIGLEQCLDYSCRLAPNETHTAERREILEKLMAMDADRHHRYRYMLDQL
jgi:Protein prenyltransferase alpha subunit repeat